MKKFMKTVVKALAFSGGLVLITVGGLWMIENSNPIAGLFVLLFLIFLGVFNYPY